MLGDFCDEDSDDPRKEREGEGDKTKAEEQPAVEPIAVDSKDATKEGITAIILNEYPAACNLDVNTGNTSACKKLLEAQSQGYQPLAPHAFRAYSRSRRRPSISSPSRCKTDSIAELTHCALLRPFSLAA
jgi:hypothetical protein